MGIFSQRGGNAAPNFVPHTELRVPFRLQWKPSAALAQVVTKPMISIYQRRNLAPYINGQTIWAATGHPMRSPQGFRRR